MKTIPPAESPAIPFEKQADTPGSRRCGAACLCMIYRSFGLDCSQDEIWSKIARKGARGSHSARTYLMGADALERSFPALVIQASDPWRLLQRCDKHGVRTILNHRVSVEAAVGHYTVLVALDEDQAIVHDPKTGPCQRLARETLLQMWQPRGSPSEITGRVLIALAPENVPASPCPTCETPPPDSLPCPQCDKPVVLQPASVLGCMSAECPERDWACLFCPFCDGRLSFALQ